MNADTPDSTILARWNYTRDEWKKFILMESREKRNSIWLECFLIVLLGIVLLRIFRRAPWGVVAAVSGLVSGLYGWLRYLGGAINTKVRPGKLPEIIICTDAVIINGRRINLEDNHRWLGELRIIEERDPKIFEITCHWNTRNGEAFDEVRFPIPKGKLGEAVRLTGMLKSRDHARL